MIVLKQLYLRACVCMSLYLYNVVVYSLVLAVRWAPSLVTDPLDTSCLTKDWRQLSSCFAIISFACLDCRLVLSISWIQEKNDNHYFFPI